MAAEYRFLDRWLVPVRQALGVEATTQAWEAGRDLALEQALDLAPRLFGPTLPLPCDPPTVTAGVLDSWPRPAPSSTTERVNR